LKRERQPTEVFSCFVRRTAVLEERQEIAKVADQTCSRKETHFSEAVLIESRIFFTGKFRCNNKTKEDTQGGVK
jgi:hypothetical protein